MNKSLYEMDLDKHAELIESDVLLVFGKLIELSLLSAEAQNFSKVNYFLQTSRNSRIS
jgi:hypothetical protein